MLALLLDALALQLDRLPPRGAPETVKISGWMLGHRGTWRRRPGQASARLCSAAIARRRAATGSPGGIERWICGSVACR